MKKLLFVLPIAVLLAAGCNSGQPSTQIPNQQTTEDSSGNTLNTQSNNEINISPRGTNQTPPPTTNAPTPTQTQTSPQANPSTTAPVQNNQTDLSKLPRTTTSKENQRVNNLFQMYITARQEKVINTLTSVFGYPTEQAQRLKDEDGFWNFSKYSLYQAVVKADDGKTQQVKAYFVVPDKNDSQKSNIFIVTGDYSTTGKTAYISPWQVYPTIYSPKQYNRPADVDKDMATFLKMDLE